MTAAPATASTSAPMVILANLSPLVSVSRSMLCGRSGGPRGSHWAGWGGYPGPGREWTGLGIVDREALNYNACFSIILR